jgi:hypothetical protein
MATTSARTLPPAAPLPLTLRLITVGAAVIAAVAHIPPAPSHLREVPYIGLGFVVLTALCLAAAMILAIPSLRLAWQPAWRVAATSCSVAIAAYVVSRTVGLPGMSDDIGHWTEPYGLVSICSESVVVLTALVGLSRQHGFIRISTGARGRA